MAHAQCINGHSMWDGDLKPSVEVYRVGYIKDFMREHPDCHLGDEICPYIYDCTDGVLHEELDVWYCDDCKSVVVFDGDDRYDYVLFETEKNIKYHDLKEWQEYIAMRWEEFEKFCDFGRGKSPLEAIETFKFKYHYKVSNDKRLIFAFNNNELEFNYIQERHMHLYDENDDSLIYL